ncbi:MAG: peptidylprolyl isomerase [Gemmatimonadales bacterium]
MARTWLVIVASALAPATAMGQARATAALREAIFSAEDARGRGAAELEPFRQGLEHRDAGVVAAAVRALGRLERADLATLVLPRLADSRASVRFEAAHAVAQIAQALDSANPAELSLADGIATALLDRLAAEEEPQVIGALARSVGRIPFGNRASANRARRALLDILDARQRGTMLDAARGLETLLRSRAGLLDPDSRTRAVLRDLAVYDEGSPALSARLRRLAWAALARSGAAGEPLILRGLEDPDEQVRRLAILTVGAPDSLPGRMDLLAQGVRDQSPMVRYEALRAWTRRERQASCAPFVNGLRDSNDQVAILSIDLLAGPCPEAIDIGAYLWPFVDSLAGSQRQKFTGIANWHRGAHAMVTLAKIDPDRVRTVLARAAADYTWQVRAYAARAAGEIGNAELLIALANDTDDNVRTAAVTELVRVRGHGADEIYLDQLTRPDYQLLMAAAAALNGAPDRQAALEGLLAALARVTRERRETSRDARVALLERIDQLGDSTLATALERYLSDFDPRVAARAADAIGRWTGRRPGTAPRPLPRPEASLAELDGYAGKLLRVTMSPTAGGGSFLVQLFPELAPATVARVVGKALQSYYDDLTFHRIEPNFVIQGGSPNANEYMGDGPYMRDEVGAISHERGTLGISTRGRDTGDAQIFVNLVDNPRLDFAYTVWGQVVDGMDVVDTILEGDKIARVDLIDASATAPQR